MLAATLARAYADTAKLQKLVDKEGFIIEGKAHPAIAVIENMSRRALATARQLKVDTISSVGKSRDIGKGAALERDARNQGDDDGLIPRLRSV